MDFFLEYLLLIYFILTWYLYYRSSSPKTNIEYIKLSRDSVGNMWAVTSNLTIF